MATRWARSDQRWRRAQERREIRRNINGSTRYLSGVTNRDVKWCTARMTLTELRSLEVNPLLVDKAVKRMTEARDARPDLFEALEAAERRAKA